MSKSRLAAGNAPCLCLFAIAVLALAACDAPYSETAATDQEIVTALPALPDDAPWWVLAERSSVGRITLSPDGARMAWTQTVDGTNFLLVAPAGQPGHATIRQMSASGLIWTRDEGLVANVNSARIVEPGGVSEAWNTSQQLFVAAAEEYALGQSTVPRVINNHILNEPPANWLQLSGRGQSFKLVAFQRVQHGSEAQFQNIELEDEAAKILPLGAAGLAVVSRYQEHPGAPVTSRLIHPFGPPLDLGLSGEEMLEPIAAVSADHPEAIYAFSTVNTDQAELVRVSLPSGDTETIARSSNRTMLFDAIFDESRDLLAVHENPAFPMAVAVNPAVQTALDFVENSQNRAPDDLSFSLVSATDNAAQLLFHRVRSDGRSNYVLVDTQTDSVSAFTIGDWQPPAFNLTALNIPSVDGLNIPAFLYTPAFSSPGTALVVSIHGGPMVHDLAVPEVLARAYLAQGLPVLTVNYRGSTGQGLAFQRAGDLEFDGLMIRDIEAVIDNVRRQGLVEPDTEIILSGNSFGGHLEFAVARDNPGLACALIAINPASDLVAFQRRGAPYVGNAGNRHWQRVYGSWFDDHDRDRLLAASATNRPDDWATPVAVIASRNDSITPEDMVAELANLYGDDLFTPYQVLEDMGHYLKIDILGPVLDEVVSAALAGPCRSGTAEVMAGE
tara:strand:+ start:3517 stop:5532 length:2016 start_codon:yes stop_codon:yes gene_type:complete